MEDEIVVRVIDDTNAENGCLQSVCDCIREAHNETFKKFGLRINTYGLAPNVLSEQLRAGGTCFIAEYKSSVIGTLSVFKDNRKNWYSNSGVIIKYVAVLPDWQGRHVATLLLEKAKSVYSDRVISISTDKRNRRAIDLYRKSGFVLMDISRAKYAQSNAVKLAYWEHGCPFKCRRAVHLAWGHFKGIVRTLIGN